ncbi:hypothetical protein K458DRAFT_436895 [Lentithecium fluviatile CBS 122367]|uniref:Uncharacterized protein n=1 Tax=Lentithecium fluviatile CBS 122367 TaxID=1168545 RepID=A0A6G1IFE7_9PLEO|nr:hypothetical protein K458DRAFT_436895 [Lentithecium fluviatile CBS 122367]
MPPLLRANLDNSDICPSCLIERRIKKISEFQTGMTLRGGIFESKQRVFEEKAADEGADQQAKRHRAYLRMWRTAKIEALKDVEMLESVIEALGTVDRPDIDESEIEIAKDLTQTALSRWENEKDSMAKMPGVRCEGDDTTRGDHDEARELEGSANTITVGEENSQHGQQLSSSSDDEPAPQTDPEDIPLPEDDDEDLANEASRSLSLPSTPARSIIRDRSSSSTLSAKKIRINDLATIVADSTSPAVSPSPSQEPHNAHTIANLKRKPFQFHRNHGKYVPGTWSSLQGYKKQQTSWFSESWESMEGEDQDEEDAQLGGGQGVVEAGEEGDDEKE